MRFTCVYCAECLCGRYFETETAEYRCPICHRIIVFRRQDETEKETDESIDPTQPETS